MKYHLPALFAKSAFCAALTLALVLTGCGGGSKNIAASNGGSSGNLGSSGSQPETAQTFTVTGLARLASGSDNSGIVVSLEPVTSGVTRPARTALKLARSGGGAGAVARAASAAPAYSAVTDATGRYTIPGVPGGDYVALAQKDHARKAIQLGVRVSSAATVLDFVLTPTGSISGVVQDATGAGVANAIVAIPGTSFLALTGAGGEYTLSDVPVATYSLVGLKDGVQASLSGVAVSAAQTTTADNLTLPGAPTGGGADNYPPVFVSLAPTFHPTNFAMNFAPQVFDAEGDTVTLAVKGSLPPGLSFNGGVLTGTPTAAGAYTFAIAADDGNGGRNVLRVNLTVGPNAAPVFVDDATPYVANVNVGAPFSQANRATDSDGHTLTYTLTGSVPAGLSLDAHQLVGTPTAAGSYTFSLVASDGFVALTRSFTLNVESYTQVSAGYAHTCALKTDGTVMCWGYNVEGQLGNGTTGNSSTPVVVSGLSGASAISAGYAHTCALKTDGTVACWGGNEYGQLGNGTTTNSSTPVAVSSAGILPAGSVSAISAGGNHTCALKTDGTVACWGGNEYGQLGNGTATNSSTPVAVSSAGILPAGSVSAISAGGRHTCALKTDGTVACWGWNGNGPLGNGTTSNSSTPVAVSSAGILPAGSVSAISAGGRHTCALKTDGTVACWGENYYGPLGNGTTSNSSTPVAVSSAGILPAGSVSAISAGGNHTCALKTDGTAACWGNNGVGQLGNGTTGQDNTPVAVSSAGILPAGRVSAISAGTSFTCGLKIGGTVACWGYNGYGQLGNGRYGGNGPNDSELSPVYLAPRRL